MSGELMALAERVEALTGPDREVDALIAGTEAATAIWHSEDETPLYTASLDAAMTLVPEGWYVHRLHQWVADNFTWSCDLAKKDMRLARPVSVEDCATPALALCAAALRARAHTEGEG